MNDQQAKIAADVQAIIDNSVTDELMCMDDPDFHVALSERIADYVIERRRLAYAAGRSAGYSAGYSRCMTEWQTSR